jgi:hypothetical protein
MRSAATVDESPKAFVFKNWFKPAVADADEQQNLMRIPTTLYLTDQQIERLLLAATRLIRNDPEFQRLMRDLE